MLAISMTSRPALSWWPANTSFALDLTTGTGMRAGQIRPLNELMSFSRSTSRLAVDSTGRWHSFGPNVPAMTDLGLWLEEARTNVVVDNVGESSTIMTGVTTSAWTAGDCPLVGGAARRISQGAGSSDGFMRLLAMTGGMTYTASRFYKYDGSTTWIRMSISDNIANVYFAFLNLTNMSLGISGAFGSAMLVNVKLTPAWNGWYRLSLTGILPNTNSACGFFSHSVTGNGQTIRAAGSYGSWADQVVAGIDAGSPFPTTYGNSREHDTAVAIASAEGTGVSWLSDGTSFKLEPSSGQWPLPRQNSQVALRTMSILPIT